MNRKEASFILANIDRRVCDDELNEALDMAIKALEQQPCGNAIDRAEAIKIASGYCHPANVAKELAKLPSVNPQPCGDAIDRKLVCAFIAGLISDDGERKKGLEYIRNMPPVNPTKTGWIPVSERLPEDRREVLVTAYWHETYQVMMASYYGDGLWWCVPFNNCGEHMQRLKPKAWMPLPERYKAEGENGMCKDCCYNDGEVHAECVICDKAERSDTE